MKKVGVTCPKCRAGFRRVELSYLPGATGEYRRRHTVTFEVASCFGAPERICGCPHILAGD